MQIKNRLFPYPILNHDKTLSNYGDLDFTFSFEPVETETEYILKDAKFNTDSKLITELYNDRKIIVYLIVECSKTVYRVKKKISDKPWDIRLNKSDFTDKVFFSIYACASKNFILKSNDFEEDYRDIEFEIEKYDIIAANDGFTQQFIHQEKCDNLAQSIFSIIPVKDLEPDAPYSVYCERKKIEISISEKQYNNYKIIYTVPTYKEVFFNMFLVPSLVEALCTCIKDIGQFSDFDELCGKYQWFISILKAYKRLKGVELTIEEFKSYSMLKLSQELLGNPLSSALVSLVEETKNSVGEDD